MAKKQADFITNYFVLPLTTLNRSSFGDNNFINAYLRSDNTVMVRLHEECIRHNSLPCYVADFHIENDHAILFKIESKYAKDLDLFRIGKYSQMSEEAKDMIIKYCGLNYRVPHPLKAGVTITDERLLALIRDDYFRSMMEMRLGVTFDDDMELFSLPSEEELIVAELV